ncbi:reverse transcriptase domain-containing protein [Tanacetum coccineum]
MLPIHSPLHHLASFYHSYCTHASCMFSYKDIFIPLVQVMSAPKENKVAENASNKRKWEGNHNGSSSQQNKGHKVPRAHTTRPINKKAYAGSLPLCNQCKFHHNGPCTVKCGNCKKVGHITQNCRTPTTARNQRTLTCYECGSLGHYKSNCPIVKFQNRVDMYWKGKARGDSSATTSNINI